MKGLQVLTRLVRLGLSLLLGGGGLHAALGQDPAIGLHSGSDYATSQYEAFGNWLGKPVMYRIVFQSKQSWTTITDASMITVSRAWIKSRAGRGEVISLPMLPDGEKNGFAAITSGARDAQFKNYAYMLQMYGIADKVIIRLGWEANGDWYPWSFLKDPNGFKQAYRRIVSVMRSVAPKLRFEFNISNLAQRRGGAKWTEGYPGNDVVDVISMDIYDHWNTWDTMMNGDAGLAEMRAFAIANNKLEAYTEWACSTLSNGHGDNPAFVAKLAAWMRARPGKVLYHSYWNTVEGADAVLYSTSGPTKVPQAAAAYRAEFGPSTPPTISAIADQELTVGSTSKPIAFTIADGETPASNLTLIANASNTTLLPVANITFGGSGSSRTVTLKPAAGQTGWTTVWIKVSDGTFSAVSSFVLHVLAVPAMAPPQPPTMLQISDLLIKDGATSASQTFTLSDPDTPLSELSLIANVSNPALVPLSNVTIGGSGSQRTITVKPVPNQSGWSTIWLKVSDGTFSTVKSFVVNVAAPAYQHLDIGKPAVSGSVSSSSGRITVRGGGYDIYNKRDEFSFVQQPVSGDAELTVRVSSLTKAHDWTKAGLMFRNSTAENAAYVGVFVTPTKGIMLQWRSTDGAGTASSIALPGAAPQWLRLLRSANSFFAFCSRDGVTWEFVETVDVLLKNTTAAGLALTSHSTSAAATAVFENYRVD